jgi:hypothetical protein
MSKQQDNARHRFRQFECGFCRSWSVHDYLGLYSEARKKDKGRILDEIMTRHRMVA